MPGSRCPECGGRLTATRRAERPGDETPETADVDERDLAAADVDHREEITLKHATLVCQDCGATLQAPDL